MKKLSCCLGAFALFVCGAAFAEDPDWTARGQRWWAHVRFLADDSLEGRETGSPGFEKAAAYVVGQFRSAGLQPAGSDGYLQHVDFNVVKIDEARCSLELLRDATVQTVKLGEDAAILVSSGSAEKVEAPPVFVGYGLTVPELKYDDLAGQDLTGKIAAYVTGGPADMSGPIKAHYQSDEERRKAMHKAGDVNSFV